MKKKPYSLIIPVVGAFSVLIYGVNAAASIANVPLILPSSYSEPLNMILIGFSFIGIGRVMRMRIGREKGAVPMPQKVVSALN